jgi:hypothetical protein
MRRGSGKPHRAKPRRLPTRTNTVVALVTAVSTVAGGQLLSSRTAGLSTLVGRPIPTTSNTIADPPRFLPPAAIGVPTSTSTPTVTRPATPSCASSPAMSELGSVPLGMEQGDGSASTTPAGLSHLTAYAGPGSIVVSWRPPPDPSYRVHTSIVDADTGLTPPQCVPSQFGNVFTHLIDGDRYEIQVTLLQGTTVIARQTVQATPHPAVLDGRTTRLWFDVSQQHDVVTQAGAAPSSGAPVRELLDLSASGTDARPAAGWNLPTLGLLNNRPALAFTGDTALAFPAAALPTGTAESTVYAAAALDDPNSGATCFAVLISWGSPNSNASREIHKGCHTSFAYADTFGTWEQATPTQPWGGRPQTVRADFGAAAVSLWMNGKASYVWPEPAGTTLATSVSTTALLGAAPWNQHQGWRGRIGEVIVLSAPPTPAENAAITDYLTRKWGT